jgi:perosamine synthetase
VINLSKPSFNDKEEIAIKEVLASGWVAGQGPKNKELSDAICKYTGTKYSVPVNNCTAGLHLALLAIGVKAGDEVMVSDFTFPATGHAVMYCGAIPRFIDVDLSTYNINVELIEEKINNKTKAIIVVHALGQMAQMDEIISIAKKHHLRVIEDAACSLGATYKGIPAGKYGDITAFSFHARKNVTSGEGGIVVTDNEEYAKKMSSLACFGMESALTRQNEFSIPSFESLGYNYKLSDINAAIALAQLHKYEDFLKKRFSLVSLYNELLKENKYISTPVEAVANRHVYQTYAILLDERIDRNMLIQKMRVDEVQTQIGTYASFIQPVYKSKDICPNSLRLYNSALALPLHNDLSESDIVLAVETLNKHINEYFK